MIKHPFSFYDFIGYLIPGIYFISTAMLLGYIYKNKHIANLMESMRLDDLVGCTQSTGYAASLFLVYTIFLYIIGQILALFSNVIIEELPYIDSKRKMFGLLLGKKTIAHDEPCLTNKIYLSNADYFREGQIIKNILSFFKLVSNIVFWLVPICPPLLVFVLFFSPAFDKYNINNTEEKNDGNQTRFLPYLDNFFRIQSLSRKKDSLAFLKIKEIITSRYEPQFNEDDTDAYFHYVYHFVLEKSPTHMIKINNYVALYGFMRNMLMANMFLFYYSVYIFCNSAKSSDFYPLIIFWILNIIFLYGYLKYIRRYDEEIIFAACSLSLKDEKIEKT